MADPRTYNMAMHACIASRDTRTAFGIADLMSRRHVTLDSMHVTTLVAGKGHIEQYIRSTSTGG
jgi:pentatricopeptide repeat protein